jgi:Arylsulfotransferase (ASST)
MSFLSLVKQNLREMEAPRFDASLSGVRAHDPARASFGYNLFDGRLMDMDGRILKTWRSRYLSLILPSGHYVAQQHYESRKWGLYTWDDETVWEKDLPVHHDIFFTPRGTIIVLSKEMHLFRGRKVDFCTVIEFDLEGKELMRWSAFEHLSELKKHHRSLELDRSKIFFLPEPPGRKAATPWGGNYDYYRMNSFQFLPATELGTRDARFREGNWLISFRHGSMVFILNKDTQEVVWQCIAEDISEGLQGQHAPAMLPDGRILIFDNGRYRGWSRVIELDALTKKILWQYRAEGFYTLSQGHAQRLVNGNTLITESERGRAFEITRGGELVWEYYHPDRQDASNSSHPENFGRRQWIYRMVRYEPGAIVNKI